MSDENRIYMKPREVASRLGLSETRVYQMCASGILPHIRMGRAVRIPRVAFELWENNQVDQAMASVKEVLHAEVA